MLMVGTWESSVISYGIYNLGQNICKLFHVLAQFLLTTREMELDYYRKKANVRVASRVTERLKT